jgi:hypothetical protein
MRTIRKSSKKSSWPAIDQNCQLIDIVAVGKNESSLENERARKEKISRENRPYKNRDLD